MDINHNGECIVFSMEEVRAQRLMKVQKQDLEGLSFEALMQEIVDLSSELKKSEFDGNIAVRVKAMLKELTDRLGQSAKGHSASVQKMFAGINKRIESSEEVKEAYLAAL